MGTLISNYEEQLKVLLKKNLQFDSVKDTATINRQVNYLVLAIGGLGLATKVQSQEVIEDYIEMTFKNM